MKRNDEYVFLYTTRAIQGYVFTGWVLKNDRYYRDLYQELTAVNSQ